MQKEKYFGIIRLLDLGFAGGEVLKGYAYVEFEKVAEEEEEE